ncbi:hypothetical protein E0F66_13085 [Streptococcus pyogenes]|jgi:hypothetical protein|uniref:PASTA domain-containing protein n=3 Tax=Bacteria TaxID=2 RepID=A0A1C2DJ01_9HYPH|nr:MULTISPECIES: hypothetical protein [Mesorhizobium]MDQ0332181.1 hypothetical protein [Mesorhizobium sp. YL-MeA3-2017]OCX14749.1 hypothetical protein QV13_20205 [Mesorhizobium hungaricum]TYK91455.1 hypothetical protein E0F66_13085 [Streptococcus pyogenes]
MKSFRSNLRSIVLALGASGLFAVPPAGALPITPLDSPSQVLTVASDCYAIGQEVAAQNGGTLAKASPSTRGGQPVCVVVILVPGKEGERPRRAEVVVPQG